MAANIDHLLDVMTRHVNAVDETVRVPGYRAILLDCLSDIIAAEREHQRMATNVRQRVDDACEKLGTGLHDAGWGA